MKIAIIILMKNYISTILWFILTEIKGIKTILFKSNKLHYML